MKALKKMVEKEIAKEKGLSRMPWMLDDNERVKSMVGRKTKYDEVFCYDLCEHMSRGKSYESFPAYLFRAYGLYVCTKTIYNWELQHEEWAESKKLAFLLRREIWEEILVDVADGTLKGSAAPLIFALKNYYPDEYKDKREIEIRGGTTVLLDTGVPRPGIIDSTCRDITQIGQIEEADVEEDTGLGDLL